MRKFERFLLLSNFAEVKRVESGEWPKDNNPIVNAPHSMNVVCNDDWSRPYTREEAAFPLPWVKPTPATHSILTSLSI